MATKKISLATQLKNLKIEHTALQQLQEKTAKERDSEKSSKDTWYKQREEAQNELNQMHSLLDVLPGIPRKSEPGEYGQCTTYALATRMAAFLANR